MQPFKWLNEIYNSLAMQVIVIIIINVNKQV